MKMCRVLFCTLWIDFDKVSIMLVLINIVHEIVVFWSTQKRDHLGPPQSLSFCCLHGYKKNLAILTATRTGGPVLLILCLDNMVVKLEMGFGGLFIYLLYITCMQR